MELYSSLFNDLFEIVRRFSQVLLFSSTLPPGDMPDFLHLFLEVNTYTSKGVFSTLRALAKHPLGTGTRKKLCIWDFGSCVHHETYRDHLILNFK